MSVLSNRRYLSVWLRRLSTDRIERRSSEPVESLRRRRLDQGRAAHHRADRRRRAPRPQDRHGARRRPRHVSEAAGRRGRSGGRPAPARSHRRLVRPLYAAGRPRCAGRPAARRHRLRASVRRRGGARPRSRHAADASGPARPRRGGRHGRLRLGRGALWQARHRAARRDRSGRAAAADRGAARRCRHRRRSENLRPDLRRRSRHRARARRSPRASARGCCFASIRRWAASTSRSRRACRCPPRWPSSASPIRSRARPTCSAPSSIWRGRLAAVLERRGEGGRLFQVALFRTDGKVHRLEIGTGAPLRDPARMRRLFEERLAVLGDACDPGFGYDMVRLSALVTERSDPAQTGLGRRRPRRGAGASDRPARRALWPAPRDAAGAAGHAHSGICGGGGAGACASTRCGRRHAAHRAGLAFSRPAAPSVRPGPSRSTPSPRCRTARRSGFPGGTSRIRSRGPKARSASPWNGGATTAATSSRAIISASRAAPARGCGSTAKGFTAVRSNRRRCRAGICKGCLRECESCLRMPNWP